MAREAVAALFVDLKGNIAGFASDMDKAAKMVEGFGAKVSKNGGGLTGLSQSLDGIGSKVTSAGAALSALSLPIAGFAGASVKAAANFESAMNGVRAKTELSAEQFASLEATAMKLGAATKFSATEAAQGMQELAAAGLDSDKILKAIPGTLDLAAAGQVSVARAAEITVSALGQFGLSADKANHIADLFAAGADAGALSLEDLAESMKYTGPVFNSAGYSIEKTTAAIALLSNAGIKGSEAGTALRAGLLNIQSPSKAAAEAMKDLGVNAYDAGGKLKPLNDILLQFAKAGAGSKELSGIVGKEAVAAWTALTGFVKDNKNALTDVEAKMNDVSGAARRKAEMLNSGLNGALEQLKGSVETAGIAIGSIFAPAVQKMAELAAVAVNHLVDFATWFKTLPKEVQVAATAIVGLGAAIGPVVVGFGLMISAVGALVSPLALTLAATTALGAGIIAFVATNEKARVVLGSVWEAVSSSVGDAVEFIGASLPAARQAVQEFASNVKSFGEGALSAFADVTEGLRSSLPSWNETMTALSSIVGAAVESIAATLGKGRFEWENYTSGIGSVLTAAKDTIKDIFDAIGVVIDANVNVITHWSEGWRNVAEAVTGAARELYEGVKSWLGDKLGAVTATVREQVQKVADAFRWLLDDVITHSSIPDLVKGVEKHISTLDEKMVKKTKKQAEETAKNFEGIRDKVNDVFHDLTGTIEPKLRALTDQIKGMIQRGDLDKVENLGRSFAKTSEQADMFKDALGYAKDELKDLAKESEETAKRIGSNMNVVADAFGRSKGSLDPLVGSFKDLIAAGRESDLANVGAAMGANAELSDRFANSVKDAKKQLEDADKAGKGFGNTVGDAFGAAFEAFGGSSEGAGFMSKLGSSLFGGQGFKSEDGKAQSFDWGSLMSGVSNAAGALNSKEGTKQERALEAQHQFGRGIANAFVPGLGEGITMFKEMFPDVAEAFQSISPSTLLIKSLTSENAGTTARKEVERWIEKAIEGADFYNAQSKLSNGFTNIIRGASDTFTQPDWGAKFAGFGEAAMSTFGGIGEALRGLLGITEDIGPQIGFMLAQSFGGNLDDARMLVQSLGISFEEMKGALLDMAMQGEMSWQEYNIAVAGVTEAYKDGRAAVGDYKGAFDALIDSGGRGMRSVKDFRDIAVEGLESGYKTMEQLKGKLLADGADPAIINALFSAASERGIKSLEEWAKVSDEIAGSVVGDLASKEEGLRKRWAEMADMLGDIKGVLDDIPANVEKNVTFRVKVDDPSGVLQGASNLKVDGGEIKTAAVGAVVSRPTGFSFRGGKGLMGESGPEAILPLTRVGGRLGVAATVPSGGGRPMTVYNIDARGAAPGVTEDVRRAIAASRTEAVSQAVGSVAKGMRMGAFR